MKCLSMIKEQYKSNLGIGISEYCFANVAKFISDYKNISYINKQILNGYRFSKAIMFLVYFLYIVQYILLAWVKFQEVQIYMFDHLMHLTGVGILLSNQLTSYHLRFSCRFRNELKQWKMATFSYIIHIWIGRGGITNVFYFGCV